MAEEDLVRRAPRRQEAPWALPGTGAIVIEVDPDLAELIPMFLENRVQDVHRLRDAMDESDGETIEALGHRMKGMGGGYGFDYISLAGAALEDAAAQGRLDELGGWIEGLAEFLSRVEVVPGDREDFADDDLYG